MEGLTDERTNRWMAGLKDYYYHLHVYWALQLQSIRITCERIVQGSYTENRVDGLTKEPMDGLADERVDGLTKGRIHGLADERVDGLINVPITVWICGLLGAECCYADLYNIQGT